MFSLARWLPEGIAKRTDQFVFGHNLQTGIDTTICASDRETDFEEGNIANLIIVV